MDTIHQNKKDIMDGLLTLATHEPYYFELPNGNFLSAYKRIGSNDITFSVPPLCYGGIGEYVNKATAIKYAQDNLKRGVIV